jgi:hypothetical protein
VRRSLLETVANCLQSSDKWTPGLIYIFCSAITFQKEEVQFE